MGVYNRYHGFSLIESMIAVLIFSFGMLGVGGLMIKSVKINHSGYMRSQAVFLVSSVMDMMRRNTTAVWENKYNGEFSGYTDVSELCIDSECDWNSLATKDVKSWSNMIYQLLPNSSGSINCIPKGASSSVDSENLFSASEPYNGYCEVTVKWTESNEKSGEDKQKVTWIAKP